MGKYRYTVTRPAWENVPRGRYVLRLTDIEDGPTFANQKTGEPEPTLKLILVVDTGPHKGLSLSQLINPASWGPKSNAARWAEALAGHEPDDGEAFDFEDYLDTCVDAQVVIAPDSKGVERNKVDVVMALADGAVAVQTTGAGGRAGAGRRRVATGAPGQPRLAQGLEAPGPDRELQLPDEAWDAMQPPPPASAEEGPF